MPIRLTGIGGPLDGQVFEYGKAKSNITIGRLEDRDIRFPPDFRSISRAHLTIVVENDRYYLRPDEAVFVDGREAMRDDELPRRCELRLGAADGPAFKVEWNVLSDMPSTQAPMKRPVVRQSPLRAALKASARTRMIAFGAVAMVALVAVAVVAFVLMAPDPISTKLAEARASVYLVITRTAAGYELPGATAWVIAPGVLATNAHVAEGIEAAKKQGHKAFVRSSVAPYETHEIISLVKHPHYEGFTKLVRTYAPVAPGGRLVQSTTGYDVALFRVAADAELAPPLKLASPDTLRRLASGDEVGYVGYPSERMVAGGVNVAQPTPQTHVARITAVTDFFLAEGETDERHLIQHSLPGAGGASGSPVFNSRGEVIALFNAANLLTVPVSGGQARIPNILVNFAQRADLVQELMVAKIEAISTSRDEVWKKRLTGLPSAPEYLVQVFERDTNSGGAKPVFDQMLTTAKVADQRNPVATAEYEIPGPGTIMFLAIGQDPRPVHLFVNDPAQNQKGLARKTDAIHYPWIRLQPAEAMKVSVMVMAADAGRPIALRIYFVPKKS